MKNHSRSFGSNRKSPGFRTPSSFRAQVSQQRFIKPSVKPLGPIFRGGRNKCP